MIQVDGKLEGVTEHYGDYLIHGIVIDGSPRWNIMDIVGAVFVPFGITGEEFVEMLTETIAPDDLYSCEMKDNPFPFLGADYENIENLIMYNDIPGSDFLRWLELLDKKTQERMMSDDDYLEGYLTPGYAAFVAHMMQEIGIEKQR